MSVLKIFTATIFLAASTALPTFAMPDAPREQAQFFASCLGRYSAAREHAWLMGGEDQQAEAGFSMFEDLLDAVAPDAQAAGLSGRQLLAQRIDAKMAQARLMQAATFQRDDRRRQISARLANNHLLACKTLVIG
ncbi:hypothetical protein [uncultured Pelagimonas sp.]|uniref:hypothetical protein n=1 Tax=uncultured Pelagimonas sp. TaxID=1618102 RepID=UPI0026240F11|nr:hypothetical protein [uncultured Pelagimonas sp.]